MSTEAYVIIRQNEYMRRFRRAEATDPNQARSLEEIGIKPNGIFRRMADKDVFRPGRKPGDSTDQNLPGRRRIPNERLFGIRMASCPLPS